MDDRKYIGKAKLNPASKFERPMDVVAASELAAAEKLAILNNWAADERALQRAESEGMGASMRIFTKCKKRSCASKRRHGSTTPKKSQMRRAALSGASKIPDALAQTILT